MYKIKELYIDGFGIFHNRKYTLPHDSFILFYGKNQSGKSTLFSFMRGLCAGFNSFKTKENHYEPLKGGAHGGSITLVDNDGNEFIIKRYLRDKTFEIISESEHKGLFQNQLEQIRVEDYRSLFAFDIDELRTLALLEKKELSEKLFATGLWGANSMISDIIKEFSHLQLEIIKPRGKGILLELNEQYMALDSEISEYMKTQQLFETQLPQHEKQKQQIESYIEQRNSLYIEIDNIKKHTKMAHLHSRHVDLDEALKSYDGKILPDENDMIQHAFFLQRRKEIDVELEKYTKKDSINESVRLRIIDRILENLNIVSLLKKQLLSREEANKSISIKKNVLVACTILLIFSSIIYQLASEQYLRSSISACVLICIAYITHSIWIFYKNVSNTRILKTDIQKREKQVKVDCVALGYEVDVDSIDLEIDKLTHYKSDLSSRYLLVEKLFEDKKKIEEEVSKLYSAFQIRDENEFLALIQAAKSYQSILQQKQEFIAVAQSQGYLAQDFLNYQYQNASLDSILKKKQDELQLLEEALEKAIDVVKQFEISYKNFLYNDNIQKKQAAHAALKEQLNEKYLEWQTYTICEMALQNAFSTLFQSRCSTILKNASTIFSSITDDYFSEITVDKSFTTVSVIDKYGKTYTVNELSRGTFEQLYLSIRLSLAIRYSEKFAPFPLLLDDILVNFDSERARATLETLLTLSKNNQVIMCTCHDWIKDIFIHIKGNSSGIIHVEENLY